MIQQPGIKVESSTQQYLAAIKGYKGYTSSCALTLSALYATAINLDVTLTPEETATKTGLAQNSTYRFFKILENQGFLVPVPSFGKYKKYTLSQKKLDELLQIYKAKQTPLDL